VEATEMGRRYQDEVGKERGQLIGLAVAENEHGHAMFLYGCRWCGREVVVRGSYARSGRVKTCGQPHYPPSANKLDLLQKMCAEFHHTLIEKVGAQTWKTRCNQKDCGKEKVYTERRIKSGLVCKCLRLTRSSWYQMIRRCTHSWSPDYPKWGGAGVKVEKGWKGKRGFMRFVSELGIRKPGTEIGRYLDMGPYLAKNCKWMTEKEQAEERRKKLALGL
jgi:hypothetical protein